MAKATKKKLVKKSGEKPVQELEAKSGKKSAREPLENSRKKPLEKSAKTSEKKASVSRSGSKTIPTQSPTPRSFSVAGFANDLSELGSSGSVHATAWIHPKASVIGNVTLGPECSIWPGSVLRGDLGHIELGRAVNIQDGTVIHCDSRGRVDIGDYTLVGHKAMLHGCRIGRAALIGINSTILDGAEIGDGAMVTAGCMIRGGMKIPAFSMVVQKGGELKVYPGKARTQMTLAGSLEYVELARRWKERNFHPLNEGEERELFERAGIILKEMFSE